MFDVCNAYMKSLFPTFLLLQGSDALMSACNRGHVNIVKALLAKGASVTKANRYVSHTGALPPLPEAMIYMFQITH